MITYEALRKAVAEEKTSNRLTRLPDTLFTDVREYLDKKARLHEKEDKWELDSAKNTLQDLMDIRERKILTSALFSSRTGVVPENMIAAEKDFFDRIVKLVCKFREEKEKHFEAADPVESVELLEDVPAFVGADMQSYGPFSAGQTACLPQENARLLVKEGSAKVLEPAQASEAAAKTEPTSDSADAENI